MPIKKPKTDAERIAEQAKINALPSGVGMNEQGQQVPVAEMPNSGMAQTFRKQFGTPQPGQTSQIQANEEFKKQLQIEAIQKEQVPQIPSVIGKQTMQEAAAQRKALEFQTTGIKQGNNLIEDVMAIIPPKAKTTTAEIWDAINIFKGRKEPIKRENAKDAIADSTAIINADIKGVAEGNVDYLTALQDLQDAYIGLEQLESSTKGIGQLNTDWMVDNGFAVMSNLDRNRILLENLRVQLNQAFAANQQRRMNAIFNPAQAAGAVKT